MNKKSPYYRFAVMFSILVLILVLVNPVFAASFSGSGGSFGGGGASGSFGGTGSSGGKNVFGGRIMKVVPCTCSPGMAIIVGPPRPAILLFIPGASRLFSYGRVVPGVWTLGDYSFGGICMQVAGKVCAPYPPIQGTILKMGTS